MTSQKRFFPDALPITVRTGTGSINYHEEHSAGLTVFTDAVETIHRVPRQHSGWYSVKYHGQRYLLFHLHQQPTLLTEEPLGATTRHRRNKMQYQLWVTTCSTDWKGRPEHGLKKLGEGSEDELCKVRDQYVREMQIDDLVDDLLNESEEFGVLSITDEKIAELKAEFEQLDNAAIGKRWETGERWEMQSPQRKFVWKYDDLLTTQVYHLLEVE